MMIHQKSIASGPNSVDIVSYQLADKKSILITTKGMSKFIQPVKQGFEEFKQIELYFLLPEYFDLSRNNWPVFWLEKLSEIPEKKNTWFGHGDTIPAGNPIQKIDEKLNCEYFILSNPILFSKLEFQQLTNDKSISPLAVIPIFKSEFEFKMQNASQPFFEKFKLKGNSELIDVFRQPVARKKFMGIF